MEEAGAREDSGDGGKGGIGVGRGAAYLPCFLSSQISVSIFPKRDAGLHMGSGERGDKDRQAEKRWWASDRVLRVSEDGDGDGTGAGAQKGVGWSCGETEE